MKHEEFLEKEYDSFFKVVDELDFTPKKQIVRFLKWCFDNRFFDNFTPQDLEYFYESAAKDKTLDIPFMTNNGISICVEYWTDPGTKRPYYCRGAIDPAYCFDKASKCSILMKMPITSQREEEHFYKVLNRIMDKKTEFSKRWFKEASTTWCGYGEMGMNNSL